MQSFSLGAFQSLILLYSQALTVQVLFYPLVILTLIKHLPSISTNKKIIFGLFLIFFALISILIRGGSIDLMIILLRFYCGIILVAAAFTINKNLQITNLLFWIFIWLVFYEYICLMIGFTPFTYANFVNIGIESEIEGRVSLGNNVVRAVGPTMNSSVSGSILAIMFFYILIGNKEFKFFNSKTLPLLVGLFIAFVLCGSATAMITFIFLLLVYVGRDRQRPNEILNFNLLIKFIIISLILLIVAFFSNYIISDFFHGVASTKWNFEYFMKIFNYKLSQISVLNEFHTILFGADLTASTTESSGGDFIIFSFIYHFGLIYVVSFIAYLFYICKKENKLFLLAGVLSSMHYGTLFTLTGQVFFGALIAGSVCLRGFQQKQKKSHMEE